MTSETKEVTKSLLDWEQSVFWSKIPGEECETSERANVPASMTCEWQSREPWAARVSEDERKERLQWFHTAFLKLLDRSCQWHLCPCFNMTLRCLIFSANRSKLYPVRCEWFNTKEACIAQGKKLKFRSAISIGFLSFASVHIRFSIETTVKEPFQVSG